MDIFCNFARELSVFQSLGRFLFFLISLATAWRVSAARVYLPVSRKKSIYDKDKRTFAPPSTRPGHFAAAFPA